MMSQVKRMDFASAWASRTTTTYDGVPINVLGKDDLIRSKKATGRPQDLLDVANLMESD